MVDLNKLKDEISSIGNKIKELKNMAVKELTVTDEIGKNVQDLLAKKQLYADHNNGIGVDGKPFKATMTKAEKKKQDQGGNQQPQQQQQQQQDQVRLRVKCVVSEEMKLYLMSNHDFQQ